MIKRPSTKRAKKHPIKKRDRSKEYKKYYAKLARRVSQGKCRRSKLCNNPLAGTTPYCLQHWCDLIKNNNHGKSHSPFEFNLKELWEEQKGKCGILGIPLIPGRTASLDHIVPLSRGGTNTRDNLQFIHIALNCMKQDHTPEEFNTLLKQIVPILSDYIKEI